MEYLHMNPNFGKHRLIPILLAIPVLGFILVLTSYKQQNSVVNDVASATAVPTEAPREVVINNTVIQVEIADTENKRSHGLSNRPPLDEGKGMLFVFPEENVEGGFWMKEMYFNIDIIWINDGIISQIHNNVPAPENPNIDPNQLPLYVPNDPYDYVLEMNAGSAEKYGFKVGDTVTLPAL